MYSWSKNWPTLTELFFGKGNGPQGPLNGMTAKKPIKEVQPKAPKNAKSLENPNGMLDKKPTRGTRKDFSLQKKLKDQLK